MTFYQSRYSRDWLTLHVLLSVFQPWALVPNPRLLCTGWPRIFAKPKMLLFNIHWHDILSTSTSFIVVVMVDISIRRKEIHSVHSYRLSRLSLIRHRVRNRTERSRPAGLELVSVLRLSSGESLMADYGGQSYHRLITACASSGPPQWQGLITQTTLEHLLSMIMRAGGSNGHKSTKKSHLPPILSPL